MCRNLESGYSYPAAEKVWDLTLMLLIVRLPHLGRALWAWAAFLPNKAGHGRGAHGELRSVVACMLPKGRCTQQQRKGCYRCATVRRNSQAREDPIISSGS